MGHCVQCSMWLCQQPSEWYSYVLYPFSPIYHHYTPNCYVDWERFFCTYAFEHFDNLPMYLFMTEENQNLCMHVFPLVKTWLQEVALPRADLAQPICSFIGMTVANNREHKAHQNKITYNGILCVHFPISYECVFQLVLRSILCQWEAWVHSQTLLPEFCLSLHTVLLLVRWQRLSLKHSRPASQTTVRWMHAHPNRSILGCFECSISFLFLSQSSWYLLYQSWGLFQGCCVCCPAQTLTNKTGSPWCWRLDTSRMPVVSVLVKGWKNDMHSTKFKNDMLHYKKKWWKYF